MEYALQRTSRPLAGKPARHRNGATDPQSGWRPLRRALLAALEGTVAQRIAVQEYGRPAVELVEALRARGAEVTPVRIYQWDLPEDVEPLREAARRLAAGAFDVVLFTTAIQMVHLARVA